MNEWTTRQPCARCGITRWRRSGDERMCSACRQIPSLDMPSWTKYASCRKDSFIADWWWPERAEPDDSNRMALMICRYCPVRDLCLDYAISHKEVHGIWGGLMPAPRAALAASRKRRSA